MVNSLPEEECHTPGPDIHKATEKGCVLQCSDSSSQQQRERDPLTQHTRNNKDSGSGATRERARPLRAFQLQRQSAIGE